MADVAAAPTAAPAAAPAAAAATPAPVGEAPLVKLPDKLQNLTRPVVVSGTVMGETAEGLTRVRTAAGEVLLKSPVPLPADKPVTLQIPAGSPPAKAMVLATVLATMPPTTPTSPAAPPAVTGQTAATQTAATQTAAAQTLLQSAASAAASAVAAQPAQMLTAGSLLSAVVLAANPRPAGPPTAAPTAGQGPVAAAPTASGDKPAASAGAGGEDGAATAGAKPAAGSPATATTPLSAPLSRGATQGQPVELGGDAAHRGSQLAPPPQTPQQTAPQQPAPQQTPGKAPNGEQPPPQQQPQPQPQPQTTQQPPAPRQPPPAQATTQTPPTAAPAPAPQTQTQTPPTQTPPTQTQLPTGEPRPAPTAATPAITTPAVTTPAAPAPAAAMPTATAAATPAATPRSPTAGPMVGLSGPNFAAAPPPLPTATPTATPVNAANAAPAMAGPTGTAMAPASAPPATPPPTASPTPTAAAPPSSSPRPAPAPEAAPPPVLRAGQTLALKVVAVTPPGDNPAAPANAAPVNAPTNAPAPPAGADPADGPLLEGEVAGTTPQGKPIVALRDGMLALNTDRALPPGSKLTLQITDPAALGGGLAAQAAEDLPDYLQTRDWPALKQALGALRDIDPALVHSFLAAAMPQPNRKLGATLTFLISAMRGGDARGWLGEDATRALRDNGKESLLRGLEREFQAKEQQAAEKLSDDWRGVTLPFYDQTGLHPLHLHVRPFPDDDEAAADKGGGPKGSRFVLDVELSRLGPLQLDGMVKPPRFDLILRSNAPLDPGLRQELRDIFARCLDAVGYGGGVSFQADTRGWVRLSRAGSSAPAVTA